MSAESIENKLNWEKVGGLVPAIIQDPTSGLVLMLGYMNREALLKTMETGFVWFYSRTRKELWKKGETSGNTLAVEEILVDCDSDTLLIKALPAGPVCHTGDKTCFNEEESIDELRTLFALIVSRKETMPEGSYTAELFKAGLERIVLKVVEEALEVVQAATKETPERLIEEALDLLYHLFVLLGFKGITLEDIEAEIRKRAGKK